MSYTLHNADCLDVLPTLEAGSVDAVVTDPPYHLGEPRSGGDGKGKAFAPRTEEMKAARRRGFMGKEWDGGDVAFRPETWAAVLRVLKPGGWMLCFGAPRSYHRLACAVEDAGFVLTDCLMFMFGTGFPKGKGCLKPAYEPILLCRKRGPRVLPLGIEECRVPVPEGDGWDVPQPTKDGKGSIYRMKKGVERSEERSVPAPGGRWPANVVHDGSDEVLEAFAAFGDRPSGTKKPHHKRHAAKGWSGPYADDVDGPAFRSFTGGDTGSAARFFFCAKAPARERTPAPGSEKHPTQKPLALLRWLVKLACPAGGVVLDPFLGSGTTGVACVSEGRRFIGIEKDTEHGYFATAQKRVAEATPPLFREAAAV